MSDEIKKPDNKRNTTDDLIRVMSVIFVIMIHTGDKPWDGIPLLDSFITTIVFFSNSFFFMLSGKYNIGRAFSTRQDYCVYYKKKFVDILFPYIIVSFLLSAWNMMLIPDSYRCSDSIIVYYIKCSVKEFLSENCYTHLWFMFCLLGFILSAPFLSKMMNAMSDNELHILFGVAVLWNLLTILVFPFFNIDFLYSGWFLGNGWIIHFCMGYYVYRIGQDRKLTWAYVAGIIGVIINVLGMTYASDRFTNATDLTPSFVLACFGTMAYLSQKVKIKNVFATRTISFLSKQAFVVYLVHYNIAIHVTPIITGSVTRGWGYMFRVAVTFGLSLIVSALLSAFISPCKMALRKVLMLV